MIEGISPQIESILAAGHQAPSGENCQPWKFIVSGNVIDIYIDPEKDSSYYNWGQRASYLSAGAVFQNMLLAASAVGMRASHVIFPSEDKNHVATLTLTPEPGILPDPLEPEIFLRVTNRKPFLTVKLSDSEKKQLTDAVEQEHICTLYLNESREDIARLAAVAASNEEIMLSNESLHSFFFSHVTWTKEEDEQKRSGFFIKTLELPAPAQAAFYILKRWPIMKLLLGIGFEKFIGRQNAATYAAASTFGAIAVRGTEPIDYFNAGRALERMWLTATKLGFTMQPITGVLFFKLKVDGGEGGVFSPEHVMRIQSEYAIAEQCFGTQGKHIAFMFRLGSGAAPSARASRYHLKDVVSIKSA